MDSTTRSVEEDALIGRLGMMIVTLFAGTPYRHAENSRQAGRPSMTLVLCDMAGVAAAIQPVAKKETIRILDRAGIDIVWVHAEGGCKAPPVNLCFIVLIIPEPPEIWNKPYATGTAPVRTGAYRRAYIFYDRVTEVVKAFTTLSREQASGIILGHAIAHELGHLLIPHDAHALNGIMHEQWNYRQFGEANAGRLLFTSDQARLMQKELQSR